MYCVSSTNGNGECEVIDLGEEVFESDEFNKETSSSEEGEGIIPVFSEAFVVTEFDRCTGCSAELLLSSTRQEPAPLSGRCFRSYLRDPEPAGFWSAVRKMVQTFIHLTGF